MNRTIKTVLIATGLLSNSVTAFAACGISGGNVNIIGNEFPAIQTIGKGAMACAGDGVEVKTNLTKEHKNLQVPGCLLYTSPSPRDKRQSRMPSSA